MDETLKKSALDQTTMQLILRHVYKGIKSIHEFKVLVKSIEPKDVGFKFGFYKIKDFKMENPYEAES